jgi:xanthine/CO dehydrogenase XdhC/CoxF family maturation factor
LLELRAALDRDHIPYCLATVVAVRGSASAKPGSMMLVSLEGKNLWGWVGGGCAESYTITNCLEAIQERTPRTITADLDDEVFGLGMPCGGQMDIFLDPILPPEPLHFDRARSAALATLAEHYGFEAHFKVGTENKLFLAPSICVRELAAAIARSRSLEARPLSVRPSWAAFPRNFSCSATVASPKNSRSSARSWDGTRECMA